MIGRAACGTLARMVITLHSRGDFTLANFAT
jgi:hypothetical protein